MNTGFILWQVVGISALIALARKLSHRRAAAEDMIIFSYVAWMFCQMLYMAINIYCEDHNLGPFLYSPGN